MQTGTGAKDGLTERHLLLFGTIAQWFARYERLMSDVMAKTSGVDLAAVMLMTRGLDFEDQRRAFLNLFRYRNLPLDQYDRICQYLRIPHGLVGLRDHIVHSTWSSGREGNGIQPDWILNLPATVKPLLGEIDAQLVKGEGEKIGYTIDDLSEVVRSLSLNYEELSQYLGAIRLESLPPTERAPRSAV
jgi:hypothetical protein